MQKRRYYVWNSVDVTEFSRKHTGKVRESLAEIRSAIESLVEKRDERKDGFSRVIAKAMEEGAMGLSTSLLMPPSSLVTTS